MKDVHTQAESEFRHAMLLKRAHARLGANESSTDGQMLNSNEATPLPEPATQAGDFKYITPVWVEADLCWS